MKAVVHQAFGDVLDGNGFKVTQIQDAFVRDESAMALVEHGKIFIEPARDVVRAQNCDLRRFGEAVAAHEANVNPRDHEDACAAPGRGGNGADTLLAADTNNGVFWEKWREMRRNADRAHAGAAAAMRNAKCLVQIDVANVRAEIAGAA